VAGWGLSEDGYKENLRDVSVPIRNTKQCEKEYRLLTGRKNERGTFDPKSFFNFQALKSYLEFLAVPALQPASCLVTPPVDLYLNFEKLSWKFQV
jgi:hypothetical protein